MHLNKTTQSIDCGQCQIAFTVGLEQSPRSTLRVNDETERFVGFCPFCGGKTIIGDAEDVDPSCMIRDEE